MTETTTPPTTPEVVRTLPSSGILVFDLDSLNVGEISLLEDELNRRLRPLLMMFAEQLGRPVAITFNDVVLQFRSKRDPEAEQPDFPIPLGAMLQAVGLIQLQRTDPSATWEDAGRLDLKAEEVDASTVDPTKMVAAAQTAATLPVDPLQVIRDASEPTWQPPTEPSNDTTSTVA